MPEQKHPDRLNERSFALNFLQKKVKSKYNQSLADAFKAELTPFWKVEAKQRVIAFMILNTLNTNSFKFREFYDLFRYAEAFNVMQNN